VASRELPDIMEYDLRSNYPGGPAKAISDGVTVKHNEIIEKYAPNLRALYKASPEWARQAKLDDGTLYGFPFIRGDEALLVYFGPQFRADWLAELNLQVPTNIDDWYLVLKTFKEKKKIEFPLSFRQKGVGQDGNDLFDGGALPGAWGVNRGFYLDQNKQARYGNMEPGWRDFVTTMAQWYKEGLIDPDFPVQDLKTWRAKVLDGKVGAIFNNVGSGMGYFYDTLLPKNPKFRLAGAPNPSLKAGGRSRFGAKQWDVPTPSTAYITPANKNVQRSAAFLDFGYGEEGHMVFNFGFEGKSYNMVNGYPKYTDLVTKNPQGLAMGVAMSPWMRSHIGGPFVQDVRYLEQYLQYPDQIAAAKTWSGSSDFSWRFPQIAPTAEESSKMATIMTDLNTYTDEMFLKFVMGQAGLDQWDAYVAQIRKLKVDEAIAIQKASLERYDKR
jgi:putative aldouronate transport system substrate-binding protein